jgi:hypothetical protein
MRMIDFPFGDCCGKRCYGRDGCIEGHMNLAKGKCLIERAWVFKVKWGVGDEDVVGEAFTVVEKDQRGREKKKELAKVTEGKVLEFNAEGAAKIAFRNPFRRSFGCLRTNFAACSRWRDVTATHA